MTFETIQFVDAGSATQEVSFQSLGVERPRLVIASHQSSRFTLPLPGTPPETALAIPFESPCIIRTGRVSVAGAANTFSGGTILFQGRRTNGEGEADGDRISSEIVIEDLWYDLSQITFQHTWRTITSYDPDTHLPVWGTVSWPDAVLFQPLPGVAYVPAPVGGQITTGQQIKEILHYAVAFAGLSLTIGTIDPSLYIMTYPVRSMKCSDALKICLRPHPACYTEIDYTTTPPTFHVRKRSSLTSITLPYKSTSGARTHLTSRVRPRYDLQPKRVGVYYKITSTVDGTPVFGMSSDIYPVGTASGLRSFDFSVDLNGSTVQNTIVDFASRVMDPTDLNWWREKVSSLKSESGGGQLPDSGAGALALIDATINGLPAVHPKGIQVRDDSDAAIDLASYRFETDEDVYSWMKLPSGDPADVVHATVTAFFSYDKNTTIAGTNIKDSFQEHSHSVRVKLTTAPSGRYVLKQTLVASELMPPNLAQTIYDELSPLQYSLQHDILESPFVTLIKPGKHAVNLSGGAAAWITMDAVVQETVIDFMSPPGGPVTAKISVRCGPVEHLEPSQLLQLFNLFTNRDQSRIDANQRINGTAGSGEVNLSASAPRENSMPAPPLGSVTNVAYVDTAAGNQTTVFVQDAKQKQFRVEQRNGAGAVDATKAQVILDLADLTGVKRELKLRQWDVCVSDGSGGTISKVAWFLSTEPEDP